jgi:hypothetical protein
MHLYLAPRRLHSVEEQWAGMLALAQSLKGRDYFQSNAAWMGNPYRVL